MDTYQRMQRGVFIKGVLNGLGSKQTEYGIQAGTFVNGELVEG